MKDILAAIFYASMGVLGWELGAMVTHKQYVPPRDYQIEIKHNKALLYSNETFIGSFTLNGELNSLITKDNQ